MSLLVIKVVISRSLQTSVIRQWQVNITKDYNRLNIGKKDKYRGNIYKSVLKQNRLKLKSQKIDSKLETYCGVNTSQTREQQSIIYLYCSIPLTNSVVRWMRHWRSLFLMLRQ